MYIFYNPKKDNRVMGASDNKDAMEFPCVESKQKFHSLDNLIINDGKIEFKEGTLKNSSIIKRRGQGYDKILEKLDKGEIDDGMALRALLKQLKKLN